VLETDLPIVAHEQILPRQLAAGQEEKGSAVRFT